MHKLSPSRYPGRADQDPVAIRKALEASPFCTISYVRNGEPKALPTGFCLWQNQLVIHGSAKSQFLLDLLAADQVCLSTASLDGLVFAKTAFRHSVNYRSVVAFSKARAIGSPEEKLAALRAFTERYFPDRWELLPPTKEEELEITTVLAFHLEEAVTKARSGPPSAEGENGLWTGVLPSFVAFGEPEGTGERGLPAAKLWEAHRP